MNKHKLALIVPYRDRQKQLNVFLPHMKKFLSRKAQRELYAGVSHKKISGKFESFFPLEDYDIFIIEQMDEYPFNRGMLINSCVKLIPEEYDYFVFQDIDLLPTNDNVHYGYEKQPVHMASKFEKNVKLPYFEYIGGCLKISRKQFEFINGFSNEYWGWGFENLDLLQRMRKFDVLIELDTHYDISNLSENIKYDFVGVISSKLKIKRKFNGFKFDGRNYIKILNNDRITDITHGSFSMSVWFKPELDSSIHECSKKNPISILSRAGFHTGIQIVDISKKNVVVRCMGFTEKNSKEKHDNFAHEFTVPLHKWSQVSFIVNDKEKEIKVYLDGTLLDGTNQKITYKNDLRFYETSYFIGSSYEKEGNFVGDIAEPCWFDYALNEQEVKLLYDKNPSEHSWTHFYDEPSMYFPFDQIYNKFVFDSSFTHSNGKLHKCTITEQLLNEFELTLGVEINVPKRLDGEFKCLTKDKIKNIKKTMKLANIEYFEDPDIQENFKFFHELVKDLKVLSVEDGLSNIKFKFLNEKKYKNAKLLQVVL